MSEHTPGPWVCSSNQIDFEIDADDGTKYHRMIPIAVVRPIVQRPNQGIANAHLIAAAPALVAALANAMMPDGHFMTCVVRGAPSDACSPWCQQARAALAFARGES